MPDRRSLRGPHPKDEACFGAAAVPHLQAATADLSWLLTRDYSPKAALELVGNRYSLRDRQRRALQRAAAADAAVADRRRRELDERSLIGQTLIVDGYNVVLTLEAALSGGVLLLARDGTLRDLASLSGHYRRVRTTVPAVRLIAELCTTRGVARVLFYLDRPVSNSGRLRRLIEAEIGDATPPWEVRLIGHVDRALAASPHVVASADSAILDRCARWFNLARTVVERSIADAWIIDLSAARTAQSSSTTTAVP